MDNFFCLLYLVDTHIITISDVHVSQAKTNIDVANEINYM
jgi:hypothetical protein